MKKIDKVKANDELARLDGWTIEPFRYEHYHSTIITDPNGRETDSTPYYLEDFNLIHRVFCGLPWNLQNRIVMNLFDNYSKHDNHSHIEKAVWMLKAPISDLCEQILKVVGKWDSVQLDEDMEKVL